jgi:hypothetical protein
MNMPGLRAEASLYRSCRQYFLGVRPVGVADSHLALSQLLQPQPALRTPIICNGDCPPPRCHFQCLPCEKNSSVPSGCARTCISSCPGEPPVKSTSACLASACCPVTCTGPCAGASCGTPPNCTQQLGTQMGCTDCNGNPVAGGSCFA